MADYGFLASETAEPRIEDVLARKRSELPEFVHAHPDETVRVAIETLREYNVSQLPVMKQEPPVMAAEVSARSSSGPARALLSGRAKPQDPLGDHMSPPLPMVGSGEPVSSAVTAMEQSARPWCWWTAQASRMITRQTFLRSCPYTG
jgi:cystathionine beta-synthase